jgi:LysM repeat protein
MEPQSTQMSSGADPTARILAVIALVAAAIVVVVVVATSLGGSGSGSSGGRHASAGGKPAQKYYVVQPGDTFAGIAHKEGVSVSRLEALNPNLDTQLLPEKGCVDLVPKGCKVLANGG